MVDTAAPVTSLTSSRFRGFLRKDEEWPEDSDSSTLKRCCFLGEGCFLGGGFKDSLFLPLFGEMIQFDEHIFQMGWLWLSEFWVSGVMIDVRLLVEPSSWFSYKRCLIDWFLEEGFPSHWCHHLRFVVSLSGWWRRVVLLHPGVDYGEIRTFGWESVRDR